MVHLPLYIGFFLYTFPDEEDSEVFIKGDLFLGGLNITSKLLYFLQLEFPNVDIGFGAGIFVDFDKEAGTRKVDDPTSVRYGRMSREDFSKMPVKTDLFQVCAAAAGGILVNEITTVQIDIDVEGFDDVQPWIPSLAIDQIDVLVRKEFNFGQSNRRRMTEVDRRRLKESIPPDAHRAHRHLCADEALPTKLEASCAVNDDGFACAQLTEIRLKTDLLEKLVEPILENLVNVKTNEGFLDRIVKPLLPLEEPIPGISDISGKE